MREGMRENKPRHMVGLNLSMEQYQMLCDLAEGEMRTRNNMISVLITRAWEIKNKKNLRRKNKKWE